MTSVDKKEIYNQTEKRMKRENFLGEWIKSSHQKKFISDISSKIYLNENKVGNELEKIWRKYIKANREHSRNEDNYKSLTERFTKWLEKYFYSK